MPDILSVQGDAWPFSQLRTLVLSHPIIFATSPCFSPKSSRRFRIASPMVLTSAGYALSLGFLPFNRTRQKSNATSRIHRDDDSEFEPILNDGTVVKVARDQQCRSAIVSKKSNKRATARSLRGKAAPF
jgi:hypothetical protein